MARMSKNGKVISRPPKEINQKQFEQLCWIQCTEEEICAVLDVDDMTLAKWCKDTYNKPFSEVFRQKKQGGKASLRRTQWHLAETSVPMAIFLGKNLLGQSDKPEIEENNVKVDELVNALNRIAKNE